MKINRFVSVIVLLVLALVFASCGGKKSSSAGSLSAQSQSEAKIDASINEMEKLAADFQAGKITAEDYQKQMEAMQSQIMSEFSSASATVTQNLAQAQSKAAPGNAAVQSAFAATAQQQQLMADYAAGKISAEEFTRGLAALQRGMFGALGLGELGMEDMSGDPSGLGVWSVSTKPPFENNILLGFGGGKFIAFDYHEVKSSPDGIAWSAPLKHPFQSAYFITYANNKFIMGGGGGGSLAHSNDGNAWTVQEEKETTFISREEPDMSNAVGDGYGGTDYSASVTDVAYGNGTFVAVGREVYSSRAAYSTDNGRSWKAVKLPDNYGYLDHVIFGNNTFVATASQNGSIMRSTNGISWEEARNPGIDVPNIVDIAFGNGRFVAVGYEGLLAYSTDGARWTSVKDSIFPYGGMQSIAFGNGWFVAGGEPYNNYTNNCLAFSSDGITWKPVNEISRLSGVEKVVFGNNRFVGIGRTIDDRDTVIVYSQQIKPR